MPPATSLLAASRSLTLLALLATACGGSVPRPGPADAAADAADTGEDATTNLDTAASDGPDAVASDAAVLCTVPPLFRGPLGPGLALDLGPGEILGLGSDGAGRMVVFGMLWTSVRVGDHVITNPSIEGPSNFVIALEPDGREAWARAFPGAGRVEAMAVSPAGEVYLAGTLGHVPPWRTGLDLGAGPLPAGHLVLAKLSREGTVIWQRTFSDPESLTAQNSASLALAVAPDGSAALSAVVRHAIDFGGGPGDTAGSGSVLVGFDPEGQHRFTRRGAHPGTRQFVHDGAGNLLMMGNRGDGHPTAGPGSEPRGFVVKLDPTGNTLWERELGQHALGTAVAAVRTGNDPDVYVAGSFTGRLDLAGDGRRNVGVRDLFIAKLGPDGSTKQVKTIPAHESRITELVAHPQGGVLALGETHEVLDFGGVVMALSPGVTFTLRLAVDGKTMASAAVSYATETRMAADPQGGVFLAGRFYKTIDLGTGAPLVRREDQTDSQSMFVARFAPLAKPPAVPATCSAPPPGGGEPSPGATALGWGNGPGGQIALASDAVFRATATDIFEIPRTGGPAVIRAIQQKEITSFYADDAGILWSIKGSGAPARDGAVLSLPRNGGSPKVVADGLATPQRLAVDGDTVYFLAAGPTPADGTQLLAVPRLGGVPRLVAGGLAAPGPFAVRKGHIVVAHDGPAGNRSLLHILPNRDRSPVLDTGTSRGITAVSFDDTTLFFTEDDSSTFGGSGTGSSGDGRLRAVPLAGGPAVLLAEPIPTPLGIVRVGEQLIVPFYGRRGTGGDGNGGALVMPAAGGPGTYPLGTRHYLLSLAADAKGIVWLEKPSGWTIWQRRTP